MAAITDTVMLDDTAVSALRPFQSRNICLLEDDLAGWFTLIMSKPEVLIRLDGCHTHIDISIIWRKLISLPVNFQHWNWSRWITAAGYAIKSACYRSNCRDLIAERTGDTIRHATP